MLSLLQSVGNSLRSAYVLASLAAGSPLTHGDLNTFPCIFPPNREFPQPETSHPPTPPTANYFPVKHRFAFGAPTIADSPGIRRVFSVRLFVSGVPDPSLRRLLGTFLCGQFGRFLFWLSRSSVQRKCLRIGTAGDRGSVATGHIYVLREMAENRGRTSLLSEADSPANHRDFAARLGIRSSRIRSRRTTRPSQSGGADPATRLGLGSSVTRRSGLSVASRRESPP